MEVRILGHEQVSREAGNTATVWKVSVQGFGRRALIGRLRDEWETLEFEHEGSEDELRHLIEAQHQQQIATYQSTDSPEQQANSARNDLTPNKTQATSFGCYLAKRLTRVSPRPF